MKYVITFLLSILFVNFSFSVYSYDSTKYAICYGKMTKAHKARGFHQSNRSQSILVKETVCKAYANGEINDYEGKDQF